MADNHSKSDCFELFEKLSAYIDGELAGPAGEEIERHAEACIKCRICLETLKRTIDLTGHYREEPVPADFSQRLAFFFSKIISER